MVPLIHIFEGHISFSWGFSSLPLCLPLLLRGRKLYLSYWVSFCLCVSAPHSPFVFFSLLLFCLFPLLCFFLTEKTSAIGFLSLHIVLLLRKVSLFLMSSASVALSPRLSTTDLLAFASLCLRLSLSSSSALSPYKAPLSLRLKIKWWRRHFCVQSTKASPTGHFNWKLLLTSHPW